MKQMSAQEPCQVAEGCVALRYRKAALGLLPAAATPVPTPQTLLGEACAVYRKGELRGVLGSKAGRNP